jgi:hypothetical protein
MAKCMAGQVWDASPAVCGCVAGPGMGGDGGLCGKIQCPAGKVCCNPVMGICADPGMVCIQ